MPRLDEKCQAGGGLTGSCTWADRQAGCGLIGQVGRQICNDSSYICWLRLRQFIRNRHRYRV